MITQGYDWLMAQVEEVGEAARRIAVALLNAEDNDNLVELEEQTDGLLEEHFDHSRVALVDPRTAAMILRPPARIRSYAQLLARKAELLGATGRPEDGHALARRALALQLEAAALEPELDEVDHAGIAALLRVEPPLPLTLRQRELLVELDARGEPS
ncbi:hypothetical protein PPSIR1_09375 [Plesiocystis pacifica SIR-1]|uniref:Uncharacterized protein n=1 Tax=Plesiocystis pacifica SIR-1 TaxID=391625 RepID=A6GJV0_9BACT|nr:hypothetical protein [Plesiocystis pacifica]EDM73848.1 hypothetical protein PPSIR1_09375 [Plesiocystis pacifica SIR-1]